MGYKYIIFFVISIFVCSVVGVLPKLNENIYVAHAQNRDGLELAQKISSLGLPIYGFYDDIVVTSSAPSTAHLLNANGVTFVNIGVKSSNLKYFVLERQERLGVVFRHPLTINTTSINVLYTSFNRLIVSAKSEELIHNLVALDAEIIPISFDSTVHLGLRNELSPLIKEIYANAANKYLRRADPNPIIYRYVTDVNPSTLKEIVTYLTGEAPNSPILTRNSISDGAKVAADWIYKKFVDWGLEASLYPFRADYSSDVIGIQKGVTDPTKIVIVGAHYDSRGPTSTSATQRAPGANDNGSGTGAVIHIAKIFHDWNATFDYTIHFVLYSGEEQGLYGSAAYATKLANEGVNVIGVFNADMVAYRVPTETYQCAFPSRYSTPALADLAKEAVATYVPELTVGITTACCSDHQSYYNRGFPATGFFERNGAIADPQYHRSEDLLERTGYDLPGQYVYLTKAVLASVATLAGPRPLSL